MIRADSTKFALDEAAALAEPLPEPPCRLNDDALRFWPTIINAKRRSAWKDNDLMLACSLCRDLALLERLANELEIDGPILPGDRGKVYANPACAILDATQRRVLATCRALQVHCNATVGKADHQPGKNAAAREIAGKLADAHSLIARPH